MLTDIDYEIAAQEEKKLRHDVMAHVHAYRSAVPQGQAGSSTWAPPAAMWGTTPISFIMREGLDADPRHKLVQVLIALWRSLPTRYKALPTLGFTHFQPAQLATVGKRATLWMNELLMDLEEVEYRI